MLFFEIHKKELARLGEDDRSAEATYLINTSGGAIEMGFFAAECATAASTRVRKSLTFTSDRLAVARATHRAQCAAGLLKKRIVEVYAKAMFLLDWESEIDRDSDLWEKNAFGAEFVNAANKAEEYFAPWRTFHRKHGRELRSPAFSDKISRFHVQKD